jgi:hypothetical protein
VLFVAGGKKGGVSRRWSAARFPVCPRRGNKRSFFYRFADFWNSRNEYPRASNFLAFMSIICAILKNDMFSDKKYIGISAPVVYNIRENNIKNKRL